MPIDPERITSWRFPEVRHAYTAKDTILYALGVGCGADPADLRYVFEDGLRALPSMATVLGYPGFWLKDPATGVDWRRAVHAGQAVKLFRPLPPEGCLLGRSRVTELFDKGAGRGALVVTERVLLDEATGAPLALLTHTAFLRGQGGFGGDPGPSTPPVAFPDRPADATVARSTLPQAALIYRLSGDMNPLHADPAVAASAGFSRPILHGLCTFGVVTRALLRDAGDDSSRLRRIEARFAASVLPGETILTHIWRDATRTWFRAQVGDRIVLDGGMAEWDFA